MTYRVLVTSVMSITSLIWRAQAAETVRGGLVTVTVDQGRYTIQAKGHTAPFASGALRHQGVVKVAPVADDAFGQGQAITVTEANGEGETFQVFPALPFVLHRSVLVNPGTAATVLNKVPLMDAVLDLGKPADQLVALGTGGLKPLASNVGSYAWMAVADPASRAGVVGGWLTHERGNGVVFTKLDGGKLNLEARLEYGCLRLEPGKSVASESFIIGWFADARLGLEAWADAVAKRMDIKLPPMPIVYCTWYDSVHGGASNAKALAELSAFAAKALKPYGLTCVQIDDGWQMGDAKGNGPRKNFSAHDPNGPYPMGMKPTADALKTDGFTAGLWILPFGGTWNDPFFAPHQDWFVKKADGKPFDTAWGGTALDMTHPGARDFVKGEIQQAVHDWGYHYLKLDGLSTGAGVQPQYVNDAWKEDNFGNGIFHDPAKANIEVFRDGLRLIRKAAGPQTFILGCCAPQNMRSYAGVFGLVDAMRMGPDNGGSWRGWRVSADYGSRNYHLNGRIWWSDPDPIYVRASIPLDSARCMASWNAISGQMISVSDWLPTLPADRLDIIRRCMPGHGVTARPVDLFNTWPPRQWLVTDPRPDRQRRDVIGLFNWSNQAADFNLPLTGLGLPPAEEYIAFDFWDRVFLKPFKGDLNLSVPGAACRILAVRPLLPRPFLISTSRHLTQGILEVKKEVWDAKAKTLAGTSAVVAEDDYELRVVARAPKAGWSLVKAQVSASDVAAGVTIIASGTNGFVRAAIKSPVSRDVSWTLRFAPGKVANVPPAKIQNASWNVSEDGQALFLRWNPVEGADCEVANGPGAPIRSGTGTCIVTGLVPGQEHRFRLTAVDWSGQHSEATELIVTLPKAPELPPLPPKPTVSLARLTPVEARTGWGKVRTNSSAAGKPLTLGGTVYANGIGVHAESVLVYEVKPEYRRFVAVAGIDDEKKDSVATVDFKVIAEVGDQKRELAASPKLRAQRPPANWHFDVAIPDHCTRLRLVVGDAGDGINSDHADWVDAGFVITATSIWPDETIDMWNGFKRHNFSVDGCQAWVVEPNTPLPGKPWSWCLEFPDAFVERCAAPQLLAKGFYHAHITVGNTFGCPEALRHFNAFYEAVRAQGLAPKVALIGISRGGLYAYRWAAENPEKVSVIYGDAPVCDFKSWPAGKGKGVGSKGDWAALIASYRFKDEAEALAYPGNPIDTLEPLAKAGVGLIHVVGDADDVVPVAENTTIVETRYQQLGGTIKVIHKPGIGHHPHGLPDPTPVVEFIMRHTVDRQATTPD